jgi:hypothetical protein
VFRVRDGTQSGGFAVRVVRIVAGLAAVSCGFFVTTTFAQSQPPRAPRAGEQAQARFQLSVMEGVLEKAVENAVRVMNRQIQPTTPDLFVWGTAARARGFRLDGYGVFFDVEVPMVRQSLGWAFQIIGPPDDALKSLRDHVKSLPNSPERQQLDQALRQLEVQFPARAAAAGTDDRRVAQPAAVDPNDTYTSAVTTALMDAMLDYSGPLQIAAEEWLTVAARDYEGQRGLTPDVPYDLVTIVMRIKGGDLAAFRAGRVTRDEARKRVEVREF